MNKYYKLPRLFFNHPLKKGEEIEITGGQNHYICNVLRLKPGAGIRLFNENDGEYLAEIKSTAKKVSYLIVTEQLRKPQEEPGPTIAFCLIKKHRQDFLIEKCTELGTQTFQPILSEHCEIRKTNSEKLELQVIEASEQCERMTIPIVNNLEKLGAFIENSKGTIYYGLERDKAPFIIEALKKTTENDIFLIGPEGGFSEKEKALLEKSPKTIAVNLGPNILRAETAATACAVTWLLKKHA